MMDFAIDFRILAADSGWKDSALIDAFLHGLAAKVKDQLVSLDVFCKIWMAYSLWLTRLTGDYRIGSEIKTFLKKPFLSSSKVFFHLRLKVTQENPCN